MNITIYSVPVGETMRCGNAMLKAEYEELCRIQT